MINKQEQRTEKIHVFHRVARNSFFLLMSTTLGIVVRLAMIPIVARYLGVELFGFYALIMAISLSIIPIVEFGSDRIICRELAKSKVNREIYFSTAVIIRIVFSLFWLVVTCLILGWFSPWNRDVNFALIIAITSQLILSIGLAYISAIWAFERMEFDILTNIAYHLSSIGSVLLVIFFGLGFIGIFYAKLVSSIIHLLISAIFVYGLFLKPTLHFDFAFAKYIIKESLPVAIFTVLLSLIFKVDVFLLEWLGTETEIALFEAPHRLATQIQILATTINISIFPVLSRGSMDSTKDSSQQYYKKTYKFLLIIGMSLTAFFYIGGKPLIVTIFGNEFAGASISLKILSPVVLFLFIITLQNSFFVAIGKQTLNIVSIGISLVINTLLDLLLIPIYFHVGASIGTLISYSILMTINAYFVRKQGITLNLPETVKILIAGVLISGVVFVDLSSDIATLVLRSCFGLSVYSILLLTLKVVTKEELHVIIKSILFRKKNVVT